MALTLRTRETWFKPHFHRHLRKKVQDAGRDYKMGNRPDLMSKMRRAGLGATNETDAPSQGRVFA